MTVKFELLAMAPPANALENKNFAEGLFNFQTANSP
jgi:hypothetical protein